MENGEWKVFESFYEKKLKLKIKYLSDKHKPSDKNLKIQKNEKKNHISGSLNLGYIWYH